MKEGSSEVKANLEFFLENLERTKVKHLGSSENVGKNRCFKYLSYLRFLYVCFLILVLFEALFYLFSQTLRENVGL